MVTREPASRPPDQQLDVPSLLGADYEPFEAALSEPGRTRLAVLGDPFSGRGAVLDRAVERLGATRVELGPGDDVSAVRGAVGDGPVVVQDCQHLYARRVDGFEPLEAFLDLLAGVDVPVVTGWNRYAWTYLDAVRDLGRDFSTTVLAGTVSTERLAELLLAQYEDVPRFVSPEADRSGFVSVRRRAVGWGEYTLSIPVPVIDGAAVAAFRADGDVEPSDVVFERLAAVAGGNVGVATAIWEASRRDEMRPSDVVAPAPDVSLDRDAAFCLRVVLAKERVEREELADVVGDGFDRVLGRLVGDGLVTVTDGVVALVPAAATAVATATEREGIL